MKNSQLRHGRHIYALLALVIATGMPLSIACSSCSRTTANTPKSDSAVQSQGIASDLRFPPPREHPLVDSEWYRERHLAFANLWNEGMGAFEPDFAGFFNVTLDRAFRPGTGPTTAVAQSRAIYLNVEAWRISGDERFKRAAEAGCDYLLEAFFDTEYGGFYWMMDPAGAIIQDYKDAYGQVHPLFALAQTAGISDDPRYLEAALAQYTLVREKYRDDDYPGAFSPHRSRDFSQVVYQNNVDAFTHWFEALLALWDVAPANYKEVIARDIELYGDFIAYTLAVESGEEASYVSYFYDSDWKPSRKPYTNSPWDGSGYATPGHGIELTWLFSRAIERGLGKEDWVRVGKRLINYCLEHSFDAKTGGMLHDICQFDGKPLPRDAEYIYWPQCESARALLHYVVVRGMENWLDDYKRVEAFIHGPFTDQEEGGLYPALNRRLRPKGVYKGNLWKTNYHYNMFMSEAIRLSGFQDNSF